MLLLKMNATFFFFYIRIAQKTFMWCYRQLMSWKRYHVVAASGFIGRGSNKKNISTCVLSLNYSSFLMGFLKVSLFIAFLVKHNALQLPEFFWFNLPRISVSRVVYRTSPSLQQKDSAILKDNWSDKVVLWINVCRFCAKVQFLKTFKFIVIDSKLNNYYLFITY